MATEAVGEALSVLRDAGWSVAVHNDYRLDGASKTFWLFTHPNGRWIKGEGATDAEALYECLKLERDARERDCCRGKPGHPCRHGMVER